MARTTVYHYRGFKAKSVKDIPTKPHNAVIVQNNIKIGIGGVEPHHPMPSVTPDPSDLDVIDYYVFKDDERDVMKGLLSLLFEENPSRQDVRIMNVIPILPVVKTIVDFDIDENNEEEPKEEKGKEKEKDPMEGILDKEI